MGVTLSREGKSKLTFTSEEYNPSRMSGKYTKQVRKPKTLFDAVMHDADCNVIERMCMSKRYNLNEKDKYGNQMIDIVIERGQNEKLAMLLKYGCSIDQLNGLGHSPLMVAAKMSNAHMVKVLLENGADVNQVNDRQEVALHFAALCGNEDVVQNLLQGGATVNTKDKEGNTPLIFASKRRCVRCVEVLLGNKTNIQSIEKIWKRSALHFAAYYSCENIIDRLLDAGALIDEMDKKGDPPFVCAIKGRNHQALAALIRRKCDLYNIDGLNTTALGMACLVGHSPSVRILIESGMDVDEVSCFGMTPLVIACYHSHVDVVCMLLHYDADPSILGRTGANGIIITLCNVTTENVEKRHEILKLLLRANADPNHIVQNVGFYSICGATETAPVPILFSLCSGYSSFVFMLMIGGAEVAYHRICRWLHTGMNMCECLVHSYYNTNELLTPICDWFSAPRSLMHLSRSVIRQSLGKKVLKNIDKLPLAPVLKKYVNLSELDDVNPEAVSQLSHFKNASSFKTDYGNFSLDLDSFM